MMPRSTAAALALAAIAAFAAPGAAQTQPDTLRLSLSEAVARALATSEEVQTARAQRELAESYVVQARAGAFPQVAGSLVYNRTLASIFEGFTLPLPPPAEGEAAPDPGFVLPFGRPNTWIATVQLNQPLYAAGRVGTALRIARNVRAAADLQVAEAEADIVLQVRDAYFQTVLAEALAEIAREAHRLADDQLRQVELFRRQGTASEFDVLRARVDRDNLEPGIVEAQNARRLAALNLKRLANIPAATPIRPTTPLEPVVAAVDREALERSLAARPALAALEEQVAAREGAVRIARSERLPTVGMGANFSYQAFPDGVAPLDTDWRRDWSLSFQGTVPIFTGFRIRGQVDEARAELRLAELQRDMVREGLALELQAALGDFDAALAQIEARRATVGMAARALELAELRFRSGLATQLELSNARLLLQQARVHEAQALYNYVNALARLERASGGEVPLVAPRLAAPAPTVPETRP